MMSNGAGGWIHVECNDVAGQSSPLQVSDDSTVDATASSNLGYAVATAL